MTPRPPAVLLWGGRSQARLVDAMLRERGLGEPRLVFDASLAASAFETAARFVADVDELRTLLPEVSHFVVCIGAEHGLARLRTARCLEALGLQPVSIVHARAFVEPSARLGSGALVMPGAVVHKFARVGDQAVVNTNATVDHECTVGEGVHVMGGASVAGCVTVGDFATIGTNATVLPGLHVGEGAFVGAGAVVTRDVPAYSVVVGTPARVVRRHEPRYLAELTERLVR